MYRVCASCSVRNPTQRSRRSTGSTRVSSTPEIPDVASDDSGPWPNRVQCASGVTGAVVDDLHFFTQRVNGALYHVCYLLLSSGEAIVAADGLVERIRVDGDRIEETIRTFINEALSNRPSRPVLSLGE